MVTYSMNGSQGKTTPGKGLGVLQGKMDKGSVYGGIFLKYHRQSELHAFAYLLPPSLASLNPTHPSRPYCVLSPPCSTSSQTLLATGISPLALNTILVA